MTKDESFLAAKDRFILYLQGGQDSNLEARSSDYVKEVGRCFKRFSEYLEKNGKNPKTLKLSEVDKKLAENYLHYLHVSGKLSNRSINKERGFFVNLYIRLITHEGRQIYNPFIYTSRFPEKKRIAKMETESIPLEEFKLLLSKIEPEKGAEFVKGELKRNNYKPWLKDAMRLALYTGCGRQQILQMRFSDIKEGQNGEPVKISIEDVRTNRVFRFRGREKKFINVLIGPELRDLLMSLGYKKHRGRDRFLIEPEVSRRGREMLDAMSRGFSHYYSMLNTGKPLSFESLRKAYRLTIRNAKKTAALSVRREQAAKKENDSPKKRIPYVKPEEIAKQKLENCWDKLKKGNYKVVDVSEKVVVYFGDQKAEIDLSSLPGLSKEEFLSFGR